MPKRNQHLVPHDNGWAVRGAGSRRASSIHNTQGEAISAGREIARNQRSELYIYGRKFTSRYECPQKQWVSMTMNVKSDKPPGYYTKNCLNICPE